jgi:hypothetical protein
VAAVYYSRRENAAVLADSAEVGWKQNTAIGYCYERKVFGTYILAQHLHELCKGALDVRADSALVVVECHFPLQNRFYNVEPHR